MNYKNFNITAQVYETTDKSKQTLLINQEINTNDKESAIIKFTNYYLLPDYKLIKILSVEEF